MEIITMVNTKILITPVNSAKYQEDRRGPRCRQTELLKKTDTGQA